MRVSAVTKDGGEHDKNMQLVCDGCSYIYPGSPESWMFFPLPRFILNSSYLSLSLSH